MCVLPVSRGCGGGLGGGREGGGGRRATKEKKTHKGPRIGLETVEPMKLNSIVPKNSQISETANLRERTLW
jgi:ribosome assembly protein YihI (activator of Der GTPase)